MKIHTANYLLRSVYLEKGAHRIEFTFAPPWFFAGLLISIAALLSLIGIAVLKKRNPAGIDLWERPSGERITRGK